MNSDDELWEAASMVLGHYGDKARMHVAGRLGTAAAQGDSDSITVWLAIAERIEELIKAGQSSH